MWRVTLSVPMWRPPASSRRPRSPALMNPTWPVSLTHTCGQAHRYKPHICSKYIPSLSLIHAYRGTLTYKPTRSLAHTFSHSAACVPLDRSERKNDVYNHALPTACWDHPNPHPVRQGQKECLIRRLPAQVKGEYGDDSRGAGPAVTHFREMR